MSTHTLAHAVIVVVLAARAPTGVLDRISLVGDDISYKQLLLCLDTNTALNLPLTR